jgi:hypothetical protein
LNKCIMRLINKTYKINIYILLIKHFLCRDQVIQILVSQSDLKTEEERCEGSTYSNATPAED